MSPGASATVVLLRAAPNWPLPLPSRTVIERACAQATTRSGFRSLFMSPIKMLLGPPWTATGEPGASANNACCAALEAMSPAGREIKNNVHDPASNKAKQLITADILIVEVT